MYDFLTRHRLAWIAALALLHFSLSPTTAKASGSVQGNGIIRVEHGAVDGSNLFVYIEVKAYRDNRGVPQGTITFQGDVDNELPHGNVGPGGPSDPYILTVTDIVCEGNVAFVTGVVKASPSGTGNANGTTIYFVFTDNSGTDEPDEVGVIGFFPSIPIDRGNYTVRD